MGKQDNRKVKRLSRREFMVFTGAGIVSGMLAACAPSATEAPTEAPVEPTTVPVEPTAVPVEPAAGGKTLVIGWPNSPNGLDHEFHNSVATLCVQRNCGLAPMEFAPMSTGKVFESDFSKLVGWAAKEWELANDASSITITLKEGIMSSVGNELTADDFVYKFQRSYGLQGVKNGLLKMAMLLSSGENVKKESKYTFTIYADSPNVLLEAMQTHEASVIWDTVEMQKHATEDDPWATNWAASHWVGHGPYKLTEYSPGQQWVLERNENYFDKDAMTGNIEKIIYREIPSSANRVALLEAGEIDLARDLTAAELKKMMDTPGVRVDNLAGTFLMWLGFTFGSEASPELNDVNVRQAISYALPFADLLERPFLGLARQMKCTVAPIYPGWDVVSQIWTRDQDLAKAKEFMAKSPYPDGFKTTIHFDVSAAGEEECAIIIKSALAELGIECEIVKVQNPDFINLAFGGEGFPGLFIYRDMAGIPDVNFGTHLYIKTGHCCAPGNYSNADIDALYDEAQGTIGDLDRRIELQRQIEDIAWNVDPMGVPMQTLGFQMASRDNVTGWWWQNLQEVLYMHAVKA